MDRKEALYTFGTGENFHLQNFLGVHQEYQGEELGYIFRVWAPNAEEVLKQVNISVLVMVNQLILV